MKATIHINGKKAVKVLGAVCLATGVVALSAVVASGAAVGTVAEGFRSAKNTLQKILKKNEAADELMAKSSNEVMAAGEVLSESTNIMESVIEKL